MAQSLETLLVQLRDGAVGVDMARVGELVRSDERLPEELRDVVFVDASEASADAAGLLAVLGVDDVGELLASALHAEAGDPGLTAEDWDRSAHWDVSLWDDGWAPVGTALREGLVELAADFEVADTVMRRVPVVSFAWGPIVADAVAKEAGPVDVAAGVAASLASPVPLSLADAVATEAGTVDLADAVLATLNIDAVPVADAVRAAAGTVSVTDAVMLALNECVVRAAPARPVPANNLRAFAWSAVAIAAAALLMFVVTPKLVPSGTDSQEVLLFADAGEIIVEDLSYAEGVQVVQIVGDDGASILWVAEEV